MSVQPVEPKEEKQQLCIQCQECCKRIGFRYYTENISPQTISFYMTRGWKAVADTPDTIVFWAHQTCPHLKKTGCDIYIKRPIDCMLYDGTKDPILKDKCLWRKL